MPNYKAYSASWKLFKQQRYNLCRPVYLTALKFPIDQLHGLLHTQCSHECRIILWLKLLGKMTQLSSFNIAIWMAATSYSRQSRGSIKLNFIWYKNCSCSGFCIWLLKTKLFTLDQFSLKVVNSNFSTILPSPPQLTAIVPSAVHQLILFFSSRPGAYQLLNKLQYSGGITVSHGTVCQHPNSNKLASSTNSRLLWGD